MAIFEKKVNSKVFIKTKCGIETYNRLRTKRGFINRLRFIQFAICAVAVDIFKKKPGF